MVLDAKAMDWAGRNGIDTAKLKKAHIPVYGKWYFPEIPAGVPVVNLHTGEVAIFPEPMLAGEILFAPQDALRSAGFPSSHKAPVSEESSVTEETAGGG